jgi:alanine racemase
MNKIDQAISQYPTWVEIDLDAVAANTRFSLRIAGTELMAVVKSNGYGFGAVPIARATLSAGASALAVARCSEALILRQAGLSAPILVFGMAAPAEIDNAISEQISLTLHSFESLSLYTSRASAAGQKLHVHLKVDTGFGRLGVLPEEAKAVALNALQTGWIHIEGIYSHLAMADEVPDHPLTIKQIGFFNDAVNALTSSGINPRWKHIANSAAAFAIPESRFNLVRIGTALLGMKPFYFQPLPAGLQRVISWKTQLASCKLLPAGWNIGYGQSHILDTDTWVGVIPAGYGDGFRRALENEVLLDGMRVPVIGRVCNDMSMLQLPAYYSPGSEVILIGKQGDQEINTDALIDRWHTTQADITTNISLRVPRVYRETKDPVGQSSN